MCGATAGEACTEDACWKPRKDTFLEEMCFVHGTMEDNLYHGRFRLGFMAHRCTHLILHLVNVVGTGRCLFRNVVLRNVE